MSSNKVLTDSLKQKLGNTNKMYCKIRCLNCSSGKDIVLVAHRNRKGNITGFIMVCEKCQELISKEKLDVWMVLK